MFQTSCRKQVQDGRHPLFIKAQKLRDDGDYKDAKILFNRYLKINPLSAKSNFQLALIYNDTGDYVDAIWHYREYLRLVPNSADKEIINKWIISAERDLNKKLIDQYGVPKHIKTKIAKKDSQENNIKQAEELMQYKNANKRLSQLLKEYTKNKILIKAPTTTKKEISEPLKNPEDSSLKIEKIHNRPKIRYYQVQQGDSLYHISKKIYGTSRYHQVIFEANKKILKSPSQLLIGQKLVIPYLDGETD